MDESDPIPISLVVQCCYCPRRAWLEAQGEQTDTFQMQAGTTSHERIDASVSFSETEASSIEIKSEQLGIVGKTDVVRRAGGGLVLREYKATPVRKKPEVIEGTRVQLALQALCMQEMGEKVAGTEVYFTNHNLTVPVPLSDADFETARHFVIETRDIVQSMSSPEALEDDPRCNFCSHVDVCLPDERYLRPVQKSVRAPIRDAKVIHLEIQGTYAHTKQGRMIIEYKGDSIGSIPLETVQAVQLHGNINLSGGLIKELLYRNIPIQWCTASGRLVGWTNSSMGPNGSTRQLQHLLSHDGSLPLAIEFISSKIANQATQLRRSTSDSELIKCLRNLQRQCEDSHDLEELMGIEGKAAALYFQFWPLLIKEGFRNDWTWFGRSGRPASDPINSMLNYSYSLLLADEIRSITACGLDPNAGFLHSSSRNKPALALDLMEEFRAPVVDSVVQTLINCQIVSPSDFTTVCGSVRMNQSARKALIECYERRMATEFIHPIFKYKVSWRRAIEIQARQILGFLEHSQSCYQGIHMR